MSGKPSCNWYTINNVSQTSSHCGMAKIVHQQVPDSRGVHLLADLVNRLLSSRASLLKLF